MRLPVVLLTSVTLLGLSLAALAQSGGGYDLVWSSVDGGGSTGSGGAYSLHGSAGQPDAGDSSGAAFLLDGGLWPGVCGGTIVSYGVGCPGAGGFVPQFTISGCPSALDTEVLTLTGGLGGSNMFLMIGFGQAAIPIGAGCFLNIAAPLPQLLGPVPLTPGGPGAGAVSFPAIVPDTVAQFIGLSIAHQVFITDAASPLGFSTSNGVEITIG